MRVLSIAQLVERWTVVDETSTVGDFNSPRSDFFNTIAFLEIQCIFGSYLHLKVDVAVCK